MSFMVRVLVSVSSTISIWLLTSAPSPVTTLSPEMSKSAGMVSLMLLLGG